MVWLQLNAQRAFHLLEILRVSLPIDPTRLTTNLAALRRRRLQAAGKSVGGAFALDQKTGLGVARAKPSRMSAVNAAMEDCRSQGGRECKLEIAYFNQCGVIVEGDKGYNVASAESVSRAVELASQVCEKSDTNCQVYFSDCSHAEFVE
ncbi:DUF4189 domain-containing protein [Lysobacter capsici]|uniref:DUF4189 domain-containing protein n=2 Tax=Lysobacter TaxID=68 RepID=UPI003D2F963A